MVETCQGGLGSADESAVPSYPYARRTDIDFVEITVQHRTRADIRIVSTSGVDQRQIDTGGLAAFRHLSAMLR